MDAQLVGLNAEGRRVPRRGLRGPDGDGTVVGEVTSGALSPTLGYSVAMAYVDTGSAEPGTERGGRPRQAGAVRGRRTAVLQAAK